jgi:hypothetical protein
MSDFVTREEFNALLNIVQQLTDKIDAAPARSSGSSNATPRIKSDALAAYDSANPGALSQGMDDDGTVPADALNDRGEPYKAATGVFVYDISSCAPLQVNDNGIAHTWVTVKSGKRFPVDCMGVFLFLYNPLREEANAAAVTKIVAANQSG